ncbi:MAG TPA: sugar phosphate isomerase/epimerase family protein [Steroidobacteraceae bacterium]|nr:sugar phosphate isomerase/epimerase family protein [Steroidobacteraceae bacterium]
MELGIFSRTYQPIGIDRIFAQITQDGFQTIQFNFSSAGLASLPKDWPEATIREVTASATRSGLTICALSGTYNMAHPDVAKREADRIGFANVVRAAQFMQVPLVTLCTGSRDATDMWKAHPDNGSPEAWVALRGELDFALELAERHGVALGVEPETGNVVRDAKNARRLLDEIDNPQLKIVMDAGNLLPPESQARQREVVAEAVALLGADLALVHTKDVSSTGEAVAAGRGVVDFHSFLKAIVSTSYRGPLVSHSFPEKDAAYVCGFLRGVLAEVMS